ncbi:MAG TPA: VWA domain-containing protein [Beutenbergiaceae bacterium]|nr:VWA domain-containing protein [Beutenbergiaceae bacterium]
MSAPAPVPALEAELVGLAAALRRHGLVIPGGAVADALIATGHLGDPTRSNLYWGGRLAFCSSPADIVTYDRAFEAWFSDRAWARHVHPATQQPVVQERFELGADGTSGDTDTTPPPTASRAEILRHRDLTTLEPPDRELAYRMIARLRRRPPSRRTRRTRPAKRGRIDLRAMSAEAMRLGGETVHWRYRAPHHRRRRVIALVDVSGSMSAYSDAYLLFGHALRRSGGETEVFSLGTRLTRLTEPLAASDPQTAVHRASAQVEDWAGGTRLGDQLKVFLDRWGQRGMARGAIVVIFSDGWERGGAELLGAQARRLARLAHTVLWCNPHRGHPGYEPLTAGMQAVIDYVDGLVAGHSVDALEELMGLIDAV